MNTSHRRPPGLQALTAALIGLALLQPACHNPSRPEPGPSSTPDDGTPGGSGSGHASSIVLASASHASIGVRHTGSNETARLVFEVRDRSGRPVDASHRATVRFTLTQVPGGGAFLDPDTAVTDALGLVTVHLNAGVRAQSVQVRAQVVGSETFSDAVRVAIHGGPPHADHFSFAVEDLNVPGLLEFGLIDRVTAFVGDRHGNPVPPGTVVYFSTTGGIIQAAAATDDHGRAAVDLVTAEPLPNRVPAFSDSAGTARISVQTIGEDLAPIIRSELAVVFSGTTELIVEPATFVIPLGGSQDFTVTVWDREHHNPLTQGTRIVFAASLGTIAGQSSVTLPDTRDRRRTQFVFRLENSPAGLLLVGPDRVKVALRSGGIPAVTASSIGERGDPVVPAARATVTVAVTSRNGDATTSVFGDIQVPTP